MRRRSLLVTGGAGYIGSHTVCELLNVQYNIVVVDNLSNSSKLALNHVASLALGNGNLSDPLVKQRLKFYQVDITDRPQLESVFQAHPEIDGVIHLAGMKAVTESCQNPLKYHHNNVVGTLTLLRCMEKFKVHNIVFSSSASVYGIPSEIPVKESAPLTPVSPYGHTKLIIESILTDLHRNNTLAQSMDQSVSADTRHVTVEVSSSSANLWRIVILRYFNPIGAHPSGEIGEDPREHANLLPLMTKVALGKMKDLVIYGNDYDTPDGTAIRDYLHVMDVAAGHLSALMHFDGLSPGLHIYNLGSGGGSSVLEVVKAFRSATGRELPYRFEPRRLGDVPKLIADSRHAAEILGWQPRYTLEDMCRDMWRWQTLHPNGYELTSKTDRTDPPHATACMPQTMQTADERTFHTIRHSLDKWSQTEKELSIT